MWKVTDIYLVLEKSYQAIVGKLNEKKIIFNPITLHTFKGKNLTLYKAEIQGAMSFDKNFIITLNTELLSNPYISRIDFPVQLLLDWNYIGQNHIRELGFITRSLKLGESILGMNMLFNVIAYVSPQH